MFMTKAKDICQTFTKAARVLLRGLRDECTIEGRQRYEIGLTIGERFAMDRYKAGLWDGTFEEHQYRLFEIETRRFLRLTKLEYTLFKAECKQDAGTKFDHKEYITEFNSLPFSDLERARIEEIANSDGQEPEKLRDLLGVIMHCHMRDLQDTLNSNIKAYYEGRDSDEPRPSTTKGVVLHFPQPDRGTEKAQKKSFLRHLRKT